MGDAGLQLYHPEMFASHVRWDRFETKDASPHNVSEIENTDYRLWSTARAAGWVSSSASASGTVTSFARLLGEPLRDWLMDVGVILRGQRDMDRQDRHMSSSGSCLFYRDGCIRKGANGGHSAIQEGLQRLNRGDKVTVVVKDGQVSFKVNGVVQGTPIDLPADTEVTM